MPDTTSRVEAIRVKYRDTLLGLAAGKPSSHAAHASSTTIT
jgi:hypothetical protein